MSTPETQQAGLVEQLRAAIDADERIAKAATDGPWRVNDQIYAEAIYGPSNETVVGGGRWGDEASVFDTTEDAIYIAHNDPKSKLAMVAAHRELLADLLAEKHMVVDGDNWFTCAVATYERDGGSCDNELAGDKCDCGRDARVLRRVKLLAKGYGIEVQ